MQMFTVPQFIDAEDKIIGALTVRQFIIILVGFGFIALSWKIFRFNLFIVVAIFIFIVTGALAFVKINGRPFHFFLLNFVQTSKKPKIRVWNHKNPLKDFANEADDKGNSLIETSNYKQVKKEDLQRMKLSELSLIVDTKGVYKGGDDAPTIINQ